MSHQVETMFSVREVPWHGLGVVLPEPPTSEEAIKHAGLDWVVEDRPVFWQSKMNPTRYEEVPERNLGFLSSDDAREQDQDQGGHIQHKPRKA